jgi:hypothetical protein
MAERPIVATHPVQNRKAHLAARCPQVVTMRAYEVYCSVFRPQEGMVTGDCRGGFGVGELLAFLYARSFPQKEWSERFEEALRGMENL